MKAAVKNIVCEDRHRLEEVIPLEGPYAITIDPCNLCNFRCNFCAMQSKQEQLPFRKQMMEWELFTKIIDDLSQFPEKLKVLRVSGQGEPLLNPRQPEMIKYAKDRGVADFVEFITNGSCLRPELNQKLIDSKVDRIRISIESLDAEGYAGIAGVNIDFTTFLANIKDLHDRSGGKCEIYCKIVDEAVPTQEDRDRFFELFGDICDRMFIDNVIPLWSDFEEAKKLTRNTEGLHGQKLQNVMVCPYPFYSLLINPDGEVTVCCADWKRKLVVGDLTKQSMPEIWHGKALRDFWRDLCRGNKNQYEMCSKCVLPMYDCNDNIDEFAQDLLERLEKK